MDRATRQLKHDELNELATVKFDYYFLGEERRKQGSGYVICWKRDESGDVQRWSLNYFPKREALCLNQAKWQRWRKMNLEDKRRCSLKIFFQETPACIDWAMWSTFNKKAKRSWAMW